MYQSSHVYQNCTNSVPIIKNSQKTVKTAKMTIGIPIVTCLHRVRRIHKARVRVWRLPSASASAEYTEPNEDMFIRFDRIHERDRQMDRRRHRTTAYAALMHSIEQQNVIRLTVYPFLWPSAVIQCLRRSMCTIVLCTRLPRLWSSQRHAASKLT